MLDQPVRVRKHQKRIDGIGGIFRRLPLRGSAIKATREAAAKNAERAAYNIRRDNYVSATYDLEDAMTRVKRLRDTGSED